MSMEPAPPSGRSSVPAAATTSRRLLDIAMLYASKTGAILVGVLILPQFNRLLGAEQFGVVALILSFQALLMVLDLGMSTMVGRDIAALDARAPQALRTWRMAETVLCALYAALSLIALAAWGLLDLSLSLAQLLGILLLFWALTMQNIGQSALLARHHFAEAGCIQLLGVLIRGLVTWLALLWIEASLSVFIASQALCALLQFAATHLRCRQRLGSKDGNNDESPGMLRDCLLFALKGRSLMLFGLAGAAVMQLDKVLVSSLVSPAALAPYFLASLLCLTPLSVLAGPVAQFFQPRLIRALASNDAEGIARAMTPFVTALVLITGFPTAMLWLLREPIITAWLSVPGQAEVVAHYTAILLPGIALGALGFIPYVILVGRQDYRFQARMSAILTVVTLVAAGQAASMGSVEGVCWVYAAYHALSTLLSWARCIYLERDHADHHAARAATKSSALILILGALIMSAALGLNYF